MPISETKKQSNNRYLAKFKTVSIRFPSDFFPEVVKNADNAGKSVQAFVLDAVREKMQRETPER